MKIFRDISFDTSWNAFLFDLFVSEDVFKSRQFVFFRENSHKFVASRAINDIIDNRGNYSEISFQTLGEVLARSRANRVAILSAHGDFIEGVWCYNETKEQEDYVGNNPYFTESHTINSWIEEQENKGYGALILNCCNERKHKPKIKQTPIFYAEGNVGMLSEYRTILLTPENQ